MNSSNGILTVVVDASLLRDVDRVAAAASVRVVHVDSPSSRKAWLAASAVVLDLAGARRCAELGLPRRDRVLVVGTAEPNPEHWHAAISVGAQRVLSLPADEAALVSELSDAAYSASDDGRRGAVLAVVGGCGGAGASVFATALAWEDSRTVSPAKPTRATRPSRSPAAASTASTACRTPARTSRGSGC